MYVEKRGCNRSTWEIIGEASSSSGETRAEGGIYIYMYVEKRGCNRSTWEIIGEASSSSGETWAEGGDIYLYVRGEERL
ncbi:hypothetical protein FKM82_019936 [Ascaphus truei]